MKHLRDTLLLAAVLAISIGAHAAELDWVQRSNANAQPLLDVLARYSPESTARLGVEGHDTDIFDLKPGFDTRFEADLASVATQLEGKLTTEKDTHVQQDLHILIDAATTRRVTSELNRRLMLPYFDLPQALFGGFQSLLDPRVAKDRYPAALARLRKYTGREPGYTPITQLARERTEERFGVEGLTGPWTVEVEQNLENEPRYVSGIRDLFTESGLTDWQADLELLEQQLAEHSRWVRGAVLPRARKNNRLPPEIYADNLRNFGVEADPRALIDQAVLSFVETRDEMQTIAGLVAKERGYKSSDYRDVLRELKKDRIARDQLLNVYKARLASLEDIVRRENLVSLPERAAVIRLASEAESAAVPAPHLSPPRLIGNTGEPAEFVLPTGNPNAPPGTTMDDFDFDAITWSLTAHEARPGHELQFARMIEGGVSIARAVFAFNSANVEGWALYAEAIVKQHLPLEGQVGTLQMRMMREARAFLDPMLNFGTIEPAAVQAFLMKEVGLSEPMAKQEVDRYGFRSPGQATAYFYGYEKQLSLRGQVEVALGDRFDARSYHDFVLDQGLLPPDLLKEAVMRQYLPSRLKP
jgi:Bacterial protein of unknown function (DUF885)